MQVAGTNPYAQMMVYQRPSIQPIENPMDKPVTIPEFQKPELSPEQQLNLQDKVAEKTGEIRDNVEDQRDRLRQVTVGYAAIDSKKSQFEIYMNGMTGGDLESDNDNAFQFYDRLREIQKQNNTIRAYAAYQENALIG